jgi:nucleotide-binding universal stress UspA family protein
MNIRTILAAVSGGGATGGAVELACRLAHRFAAHLEGLHVLPDAATVIAATGEGIASPASQALAESMMAEAAAKAAQARRLFEETAARHGIGGDLAAPAAAQSPSAGWREGSGDAARLVADRARFFDLAVLGRSDRVVGEPHSDTVEETVMRSGRPVLLAPAESAGDVGQTVVIAWNGSPQAVHAIAAALPLLGAAKRVLLMTPGDADAAGSSSAIDYLAWHGVAAEPRRLSTSSRRRTGQALLAAAGEAGADLLVMGAYGQPPWREQLFGGVTRDAVRAMSLALLLMH